MDAHEGQAAWAQAVGSVAAILASGGLAVWAPLYQREIEARDAAWRARRNLINAGTLLQANWLGLSELFAARSLDAGTNLLFETELAGVGAVLAEVPRHALGPDALIIMGMIENQCAGLAMAVKSATAAQRDGGAFPQLAQIADMLGDRVAELKRMTAMKVDGLWCVSGRGGGGVDVEV